MFVGIDIGSVTTKAVIIDEEEKIKAFSLLATTSDRNQSGVNVLKLALEKAGRSGKAIERIISTGYGRRSFTASDKVLPEIVIMPEEQNIYFRQPEQSLTSEGRIAK